MGIQHHISQDSPSLFYADKSTIETRLFINNEFVPAHSGRLFKVINPATEEVTAEVHEADAADVDVAVEAAAAAFPSWSGLSAQTRAGYLYKLADLYEQNNSRLAELEARSMGRPVGTYREAIASAAFLRFVAGKATDSQGSSSLHTPGFINVTLVKPFGVCAAITPWNAPVGMLSFKLAPALAAGNTLVVKSSEKAPLTALFVAGLVREAGFPPGVVNFLSGFGDPCGTSLSSHMMIRKISFTGSIRAGKSVQEAAAKSNLKRVTLELGGKSPLIIFDDADLSKAATASAASILLNSGQACVASSRVYVHESVADKFYKLLADAINNTGANPSSGNDTLNPETRRGPQGSQSQFETVMGYINGAKESGYNILLGGNRDGTNGFFVEPTVILQPDEGSPVMREEIFGPVVCVNTFNSETEVLKRANETEYGLFASVFTRDVFRALRFANAFEAGNIGVNCASPMLSFDMPFGGLKQSGIGKELGKNPMEEWTETKTVYMSLD